MFLSVGYEPHSESRPAARHSCCSLIHDARQSFVCPNRRVLKLQRLLAGWWCFLPLKLPGESRRKRSCNDAQGALGELGILTFSPCVFVGGKANLFWLSSKAYAQLESAVDKCCLWTFKTAVDPNMGLSNCEFRPLLSRTASSSSSKILVYRTPRCMNTKRSVRSSLPKPPQCYRQTII